MLHKSKEQPKPITVKKLIQHLNKLNQNAIVYLPIDPEQNGFHTVDINTPVSYGYKHLKPLMDKDYDFDLHFKTDIFKVIINAWEYKDDNFN